MIFMINREEIKEIYDNNLEIENVKIETPFNLAEISIFMLLIFKVTSGVNLSEDEEKAISNLLTKSEFALDMYLKQFEE